MLCSRDRVRLEGNRDSNWTKGVEQQVVSGLEWTGGGRGRAGRQGGGQRAGNEAEEAPRRTGIMASHGGHTGPEASSLAVRP